MLVPAWAGRRRWLAERQQCRWFPTLKEMLREVARLFWHAVCLAGNATANKHSVFQCFNRWHWRLITASARASRLGDGVTRWAGKSASFCACRAPGNFPAAHHADQENMKRFISTCQFGNRSIDQRPCHSDVGSWRQPTKWPAVMGWQRGADAPSALGAARHRTNRTTVSPNHPR